MPLDPKHRLTISFLQPLAKLLTPCLRKLLSDGQLFVFGVITSVESDAMASEFVLINRVHDLKRIVFRSHFYTYRFKILLRYRNPYEGVGGTRRASLSGTFLQTLPELVTLKGHSLSLRNCPPTRSAPSKRLGY